MYIYISSFAWNKVSKLVILGPQLQAAKIIHGKKRCTVQLGRDAGFGSDREEGSDEVRIAVVC
jgi:hypothetical protein